MRGNPYPASHSPSCTSCDHTPSPITQLTHCKIVAVKVLLWIASIFVNFEAATWDDQLVGGLGFVASSVLQLPLFLMSLMRYITPALDHMYELPEAVFVCS